MNDAYIGHCAVVNRMAEMRANKPRPLAKLYGKAGPTEVQRAEWDAAMRAWNSEYRKLGKLQKALLEESNREFWERSGS